MRYLLRLAFPVSCRVLHGGLLPPPWQDQEVTSRLSSAQCHCVNAPDLRKGLPATAPGVSKSGRSPGRPDFTGTRPARGALQERNTGKPPDVGEPGGTNEPSLSLSCFRKQHAPLPLGAKTLFPGCCVPTFQVQIRAGCRLHGRPEVGCTGLGVERPTGVCLRRPQPCVVGVGEPLDRIHPGHYGLHQDRHSGGPGGREDCLPA